MDSDRNEDVKTGYLWIVDADFKSYFDTIPRKPMIERVEEKISDGTVIEIIEAYMKQDIMDGMERWTPEEGTPQGAIISPLLSNIYLHPLDQEMARKGYQMVRYADDFVVLCRSQAEAEAALEEVRIWTAHAELMLHPDKTRIVNAAQSGGFDFLGYHFERGMKWPRTKSLAKFKATIRRKTRRTNGHSLRQIITDVNTLLEGWFAYFKHSHKTTFSPLDAWLRMRLRSILRKRRGRKGRGRGLDHQRWPNAFFTAQGLISLTIVHAQARQSSLR
jgi:RNA-directed DNA polymerase